MMHGKWGRSKLCPMSLGLALGLTSALAAFLMASWAIYQGVPPDMLAQHPDLVPMTWADAGWLTLWTFIKGLIFGFILALIYDLITCGCKGKCCRGSCGCGCGCQKCATTDQGGRCNCGCSCCSSNTRPLDSTNLNNRV